jgi:pectate lyase
MRCSPAKAAATVLCWTFAIIHSASSAEKTAPSFQPLGFATVAGYGVERLTGGGNAPVVEVRTAAEFQAAAERRDIKKKADRENAPRVIKVMADLDLGELATEPPGNELKAVGRVRVCSHTTLFAPGVGATLRHGIVEMHGAHNVIIRNLRFRDLWENDPTGEYDRFGWDYVRIASAGKIASHHVWIDHCDFGKCYDGQCDITHGSDLVTISWCHFAGDERGPHKKSMLIGHSSSPTAGALDRGHLNVTLHHNWFENIDDRAPRARWGNIHICNDLVTGAENATISVMNAVTLIERSVYQDARIATSYSHAADSEDKDHAGTICIVESLNENPRPPVANPNSRVASEIEANFKSNVERGYLTFNPVTDWPWKDPHLLPYAFTPDPTAAVPEIVRRFAGTGKLSAADLAPAAH